MLVYMYPPRDVGINSVVIGEGVEKKLGVLE